MSIELCLFRHGRTVWNAEGRYQGHTDVELDELGRRQTRAVARRCQEMRPVAVYSSDLRRCADMGRAISEAAGIDLVEDPRLRERDVGAWSGLTRIEVRQRFAEEYAAWEMGDESVRPGGGEAIGDVVARIDGFVSSIRAGGISGSIVAVTHAAWIRSLVPWMFGKNFPRRSTGVPAQGSLTVLHIDDDGLFRLEAYNDRGHLLEVEEIDREGPAPAIY